MTNYPDQPSGANEFAPLENTPQQPDPYAPVDYPMTSPGVSPTVLGPAYPPPPGYPQVAGYPPPVEFPAHGYPPPPAVPPYAGAYPYAANPHDPYRATQPGTNGMAIGALVASLVGLPFCGLPAVIGLVLGIIAMRETRRTGQEGYGLALAGAIIGAVVTALWLIYLLLIIVGIAADSSSYS